MVIGQPIQSGIPLAKLKLPCQTTFAKAKACIQLLFGN